MKVRITYPYLLECCNYTNDAYWKSIFTNLSYGIPPHGVYIHKDFLVCNYKDKSFSYKLTQKDPKETFSDIYKLFKNKLQMVSRDDILKKQDELETSNKLVIYNNWVDIKRKNIKDTLIENFVLVMKSKYSLSYKQTRDLLNIINVGIIFKYIGCKDIIMQDGEISHISCIIFRDENTKDNSSTIFGYARDIFKNCETAKNISSSTLIFKSDTNISKEWDKYLSYYKKNYER